MEAKAKDARPTVVPLAPDLAIVEPLGAVLGAEDGDGAVIGTKEFNVADDFEADVITLSDWTDTDDVFGNLVEKIVVLVIAGALDVANVADGRLLLLVSWQTASVELRGDVIATTILHSAGVESGVQSGCDKWPCRQMNNRPS